LRSPTPQAIANRGEFGGNTVPRIFTVTTFEPSGEIAKLSGELSAIAVETKRCLAWAAGGFDAESGITETVPRVDRVELREISVKGNFTINSGVALYGAVLADLGIARHRVFGRLPTVGYANEPCDRVNYFGFYLSMKTIGMYVFMQSFLAIVIYYQKRPQLSLS
jgi:hypothetical protein